MGGSAGGGDNSQILSLLSQYGGSGSAAAPRPLTHDQKQARFQSSLDDFMKSNEGGFNGVFGGFGDWMGGGGGAGGGKKGGGTSSTATQDPSTATNAQNTMNWQFPQYTQTWAFTPPAPLPYNYPQPFDPNKYGNPLKNKDVKKNR